MIRRSLLALVCLALFASAFHGTALADPAYPTSAQYGGADGDINTTDEWRAAITRWGQVVGGSGARQAYLDGLTPSDRAELPNEIQSLYPLSYSCGVPGAWSVDNLSNGTVLSCVVTGYDAAVANNTASSWIAQYIPGDQGTIVGYIGAHNPTTGQYGGSDADVDTDAEFSALVDGWDRVVGGTDGRTAFLNGLTSDDRGEMPAFIQQHTPISYECGLGGTPQAIWSVDNLGNSSILSCVMSEFSSHVAANNAHGFWINLTPIDATTVRAYLSGLYPTSAEYGGDDVDVSDDEMPALVDAWDHIVGGTGMRTAFFNGLSPDDQAELPQYIHDHFPISWTCGSGGTPGASWSVDNLGNDAVKQCVIDDFNHWADLGDTHEFWINLTPVDQRTVLAYFHATYSTSFQYGGDDYDISGSEWTSPNGGAMAGWDAFKGGAGGREAFLDGMTDSDQRELNARLTPNDTQRPVITVEGRDNEILVEATDPRGDENDPNRDDKWSGIRSLQIAAYAPDGSLVQNWSGARSFTGSDAKGNLGCPVAMLRQCDETHHEQTALGSLPPGFYTVHIVAIDGVGNSTTVDYKVGAGFNIDIDFDSHDSLTDAQRQTILDAAAFWSNIITADIPAYTATNGFVVDDLRVSIQVADADHPLAPGSQASTHVIARRGQQAGDQRWGLPALARITLNPSTISPWLLEHELGHALGFGTNWGCFLRNGGDGGAAPNHVDTDPQFVGPQAVAAYRALTGNQNEQTVPVAGTAEETVPGSAGTIRDAHWRQSLFNTDLMVHNIGIKLSLVTIASMADLGYTVNPGAATPGFSLSTLPPTPEQPGAAANNCSQQPKNDDGY